jgi:hypothetical protein
MILWDPIKLATKLNYLISSINNITSQSTFITKLDGRKYQPIRDALNIIMFCVNSLPHDILMITK